MNTSSRRFAGAALILTSTTASTAVFADGGEPAGAWSALASLVLPLLLIAAAAAAATFVLTRWKGSVVRRDGPMQLLQILALGPRERLALVRAGSRYLVVGITAGGISRVAEFERLDEAAALLQPENNPGPRDDTSGFRADAP